ncbi:MAG: hypothetical protein ABL872_12480 [Lacibacter sp.]
MTKKRKNNLSSAPLINRMGFETIQLTGQQIEELYSSHLVITQKTGNLKPETTSKPAGTGITGKNKKQFVWVVNEASYPFLSDEDFQFLSEVVNACKMNMDDIALMNIAQNNLDFEQTIAELKPKILIVSFLDRNWIPANKETYTLQQEENFQFYITEELQVIRNDKVKKSKLWLALKQMLGL